MSDYSEIMKALAFAQGAFYFGFSLMMLLALARETRQRGDVAKLMNHAGVAIIVGISLITLYRSPYPGVDIWYIGAIIGYLLIDIGLVWSFKLTLEEIQQLKSETNSLKKGYESKIETHDRTTTGSTRATERGGPESAQRQGPSTNP